MITVGLQIERPRGRKLIDDFRGRTPPRSSLALHFERAVRPALLKEPETKIKAKIGGPGADMLMDRAGLRSLSAMSRSGFPLDHQRPQQPTQKQRNRRLELPR